MALLCAVCCLLLAVVGCESLQRKFTRKSKHPAERPTPIINFQDYTQAMTPEDRYRKHYLMFQYYNDELIAAFSDDPISQKRVRQMSGESLSELKKLQGLLQDSVAERLAALIGERARLDHRLQSSRYLPGEQATIQRTLESQTRRIDREFFWKDVQDYLKGQTADHAQ